MSCVVPANDKHYGYGDPCLILKFLIRFNATASCHNKRRELYVFLLINDDREAGGHILI